MEQKVIRIDHMSVPDIVTRETANGWHINSLTPIDHGIVLILMTKKQYPFTAKALAYLAASDDPEIAQEAYNIIAQAIEAE